MLISDARYHEPKKKKNTQKFIMWLSVPKFICTEWLDSWMENIGRYTELGREQLERDGKGVVHMYLFQWPQ